jgi:hypothetical protein
MSQRWRKITLAADDLPLVVLWNEMLAATGIPESRAWQLVQEGTFPIRHLPYHGYSPRDQGARLCDAASEPATTPLDRGPGRTSSLGAAGSR